MTDRPWSLISNAKEFECGKVMEYLDSYLAGELTVETNHAILGHLQRCLGCKSEVEAREALYEAVRRIAARVPEPSPGLEERLRSLLAATPAPVGRGPFAFVAGILAAGFLVVAGIVVLQIRNAHRFARPIDMQVHCTLKRTWPKVSPGPEELAREAGPEWAGVVRAAVSRLAGYQVLSAHECAVGGAMTFHLVLRSAEDGRPSDYVSVVVARASGNGALPQGPEGLPGGWAGGFYVLESPAGDSVVYIVSRRGRAEDVEVARAVLPGILGRHAASAVKAS